MGWKSFSEEINGAEQVAECRATQEGINTAVDVRFQAREKTASAGNVSMQWVRRDVLNGLVREQGEIKEPSPAAAWNGNVEGVLKRASDNLNRSISG